LKNASFSPTKYCYKNPNTGYVITSKFRDMHEAALLTVSGARKD